MTRETSIKIYHQVKASNLLSKRRFEVFEALCLDGPLTINEVVRKTKRSQFSISPRFSELRTMGVIKEVGERQCTVTGMNVLIWDVTGNLPTAFPKMKSKKEIKKELINKIETLGFKVEEKWKPPLREIYILTKSL